MLEQNRNNQAYDPWTRSLPRSCASWPMPPNTMPPAPRPARRSATAGTERPRLDHRHRHLPRLHAGRPLRLAAEDPADQLLPVTTAPIASTAAPRTSPRARFTVDEVVDAHARVLQAQLHRGPVPLLRHHPLARPHHGADAAASRRSCAATTAFAGYIHLKTIPEASPWLIEQAGPLGRPPLDQPRAADRAEPASAWRRRRTRASIERAMGQMRERIDEARKAEQAPLLARRPEHADDRRRRRRPPTRTSCAPAPRSTATTT